MTARRRTDPAEGDIAVALAAMPPEPARVIETPPEPEKPKVKICDAKKLLSASVLELLQSFPENATVRTMAQNQLNHPLPDDKRTFKDIIEWIEYNPEFGKKPVRPDGELALTLYKEGVEYGTGNYRVGVYGNEVFKLKESQMLEMANASTSWSDFWHNLTDYIGDNEAIHMEWSGTLEVDHPEVDNMESDAGWQWSHPAAAKDAIRNRLRELLDHSSREKLGL